MYHDTMKKHTCIVPQFIQRKCATYLDQGIFKSYKFHTVIRSALTSSMSKWNTDPIINGGYMSSINIQCGIFQGDSLFPV